MGPNPRFEEDSAADLNPDAEILVQHVVMTLVDVPVDCKESGIIPTERADEAKWELDPAQESIDPANPVCQVCGQPIIS